MGASFRGWVPNATGNLSFSLIGQIGQPSACDDANFVSNGRRVVAVRQRRNLSDNLLFKNRSTVWTGVHEFDFTVVGRTSTSAGDGFGVLKGWIFIHEHCPGEISFLDRDSFNPRELSASLAESADFGVAFRLNRTGRMEVRVPPWFTNQTVKYGAEVQLPQAEALRPLAAQCFYFLRDITHRHQHHSDHSDTLTTVWPTDDGSRWVRETLYELYRRVLMLRRQRSPKGQEDALGLLAYLASFESAIATPYRDLIKAGKAPGFVPTYDKTALKESLNANLETKRRKRVQRNVVAAVIPAFTAAMLGLANGIYRDPSFVAPTTLGGWLTSFAGHPITSMIGLLQSSEWLFPVLAVAGFTWIAAFAGVMQPSEGKWVKRTAQVSAVLGPRKAPIILACISIALAVLSWLLIR